MTNQSELFPIEVDWVPEFGRQLKQLQKRYRSIQSDLRPLIQELQDRQLPGVQIKGAGRHVRKVRLRNSSANRGKSGGFRVIYYVATATRVTLLTIYSKTDQPDVSLKQIKALLASLD